MPLIVMRILLKQGWIPKWTDAAYEITTCYILLPENIHKVYMGQRLAKYEVLIAIDFGTTYSGYVYSYRGKKEKIHDNPNWGAELGHLSFKTPTSMLYNNNEAKHFGFEAEKAYFEMIEDPEFTSCNPMIFKAFKMQLYEEVCKFSGSNIKL